jgi:hypothetical protein
VRTVRSAATVSASAPARPDSISTRAPASAPATRARPVDPPAAQAARPAAPTRSPACPAAIKIRPVPTASTRAVISVVVSTSSAAARRITPSTAWRPPATRANHVGRADGVWSGTDTEPKSPALGFSAIARPGSRQGGLFSYVASLIQSPATIPRVIRPNLIRFTERR